MKYIFFFFFKKLLQNILKRIFIQKVNAEIEKVIAKTYFLLKKLLRKLQ